MHGLLTDCFSYQEAATAPRQPRQLEKRIFNEFWLRTKRLRPEIRRIKPHLSPLVNHVIVDAPLL